MNTIIQKIFEIIRERHNPFAFSLTLNTSNQDARFGARIVITIVPETDVVLIFESSGDTIDECLLDMLINIASDKTTSATLG